MAQSDIEKISRLLARIREQARFIADLNSALPEWNEQKSVHDSVMRLTALAAELSTKVVLINATDISSLQHELDELRRFVRTGSLSAFIMRDGKRTAVAGLLEEHFTLIQNSISATRIGLLNLADSDLSSLVPDQKPAAYQFEFVEEVLLLKSQFPVLTDQERALAESAFSFLVKQIAHIAEDLHRSNAPPRLKTAFDDQRERLLSKTDIVGLGLANQTLSSLIKASVEELSPTLFELLRSYAQSVYDYLSQFPEWRQFCENALAIRLTKSEIFELSDMANKLADHVAENAGFSGPSVEGALRTASTDVVAEEAPDPRKVFSLARTLENFLSAVARGLTSVKTEVLSLLRKKIAKGILILASTLALHLFDKIPGGDWVNAVVTRVIQLENASE